MKGLFFDQNLTATLAFYQLTKDNIATAAPGSLTTSIVGNVRSRGIELDVSGRVNDNLSLIGNYAHTQTKILDFADENPNLLPYVYPNISALSVSDRGNWWPNVPPNSGSIWAKYDWNGYLAKEGASFGLGARYEDVRWGDRLNSFQLPAYAGARRLGRLPLEIRRAVVERAAQSEEPHEHPLFHGGRGETRRRFDARHLPRRRLSGHWLAEGGVPRLSRAGPSRASLLFLNALPPPAHREPGTASLHSIGKAFTPAKQRA